MMIFGLYDDWHIAFEYPEKIGFWLPVVLLAFFVAISFALSET